jgi:CheY-like chemotaxis protein
MFSFVNRQGFQSPRSGTTTITRRAKNHYSYPILDKDTSFSHPDNDNSDPDDRSQHSFSSSPPHPLQNQESNSNTSTDIKRGTKEQSFLKRILIVDDDPDLTLTFKVGLEEYSYDSNDKYNKKRFEVYTYNSPSAALSEFKPHFYDLLLTDIYMPHINGFELCQKILELDANVQFCNSIPRLVTFKIIISSSSLSPDDPSYLVANIDCCFRKQS